MQRINRTEGGRSSQGPQDEVEWASLEEFARRRIQSWLQDLLEEEVTELL